MMSVYLLTSLKSELLYKNSEDTENPQIQVSLILEFPVTKEMRLKVVIPKLYGIEIVGVATGF